MERREIIEVFKRFVNTSGLSDKHRNLFEDTKRMYQWLGKMNTESDDELTKQLLTDLTMDCIFRTYNTARYRKVNYVRCSDGKWDSSMLHDAERVLEQIKVSEKFSDTEMVVKLFTGFYQRFIHHCLTEKDMPALGMYMCEMLMGRCDYANQVLSEPHDRVETYMCCKTDEILDARLSEIVKPAKKPVTDINLETAPEVSDEISKRAYSAYLSGDVDGIRRCINDVTALYAKGYFNRHGMSEENATAIFKGWVSAFNKRIIKITEGKEEPYGSNPLDLIKTIVSSSESLDENELTP